MGKGKNVGQIFYPPPHGLMYRRTKIGGADVDQLVLPECKRLEVIQRAHDDVMVGHLACRKTMQKITQCFFSLV